MLLKTVSPNVELESSLTRSTRSLKGETVMEVYIGVDFHPHQQTIAWCDRETGETETVTLDRDRDREKVREFYSSFDEPAIVGGEALGRAL
jgi:hypothetical protein